MLARELNLKEIGMIAAAVPEIELEVFVHGAMCMAYSGRCFLSHFRNRRSANQGDCSQPCRWEYLLQESTRPGDPLILEEDERYSYLLSSRDLCLIEHLPEVISCGGRQPQNRRTNEIILLRGNGNQNLQAGTG